MNKSTLTLIISLTVAPTSLYAQTANPIGPVTTYTVEKIFLSGNTSSSETKERLRKEAESIMRKKGYTKWEIVKIEKAWFPLVAADYTIKYSK